jgi:hypothetical protein
VITSGKDRKERKNNAVAWEKQMATKIKSGSGNETVVRL